MKKLLIKGILIGGSFGVLSALFGFYDNMPKAFFLGVLGGLLAGVTLGVIRRKNASNLKKVKN